MIAEYIIISPQLEPDFTRIPFKSGGRRVTICSIISYVVDDSNMFKMRNRIATNTTEASYEKACEASYLGVKSKSSNVAGLCEHS